jgi:hypothetical protein
MKKKLNTGSGGMDTKIRERNSGIFWEAEADILRDEQQRVLRDRIN